MEEKKFEILTQIESPDDLKNLSHVELKQLAGEIRGYLVNILPATDSHLASSLGVVELTVALHYIFQTPRDLLIWDVGHQSYVHKLLTGRREALENIRRPGGISGFPVRDESVYDNFGTGHASTSISAALGLAAARDLKGEKHKVVAVIGDGSLSGGMAYEGLNNAGQSGKNLLVVLNDNTISISRTVGGIANYLNMIITNPYYEKVKSEVWDFTAKIPPLTEKIRSLARRTQDSIKTFILPGLFFEDLGLRYFGPINGHDMEELLHILGRIKDLRGPVLLHVLTKKGKGSSAAEKRPAWTRGFNALTREPTGEEEREGIAYSEVFGKTVTQLAEKSDRLCAVTPAMGEETGLNDFREKFPERLFDVGIAEEHAVTFAAGLAAGGNRPVVSLYSTFLQRAFDQMIHDVSLQRLPVIFAIDRAGLVGEDGPTHHGIFDLSYMNPIPNLIISAPKDGQELRNLLYTALMQDREAFAIRYPHLPTPDDVDLAGKFREIGIGEWEIVNSGERIAILAVGSMVAESLRALEILKLHGINPTIVNCRFVKPLDEKLLHRLAHDYKHIYTVEENVLEGGFGQKIADFLQKHGYPDHIYLQTKGIPDKFVEHGSRDYLLDLVGLSSQKLAEWILEAEHIEIDQDLFAQKNQVQK